MPTPILAYVPPYGVPVIPQPATNPQVRWEYRPEIVALLTADGTPSLQGLVTASYYLPTSMVEIVITIDDAEERQTWVLHTGDVEGESDVLPDDYNGITNNVHWQKGG